MNEEIHTRIQAELRRIEGQEDVTILFACESGSRAWGFESTDSDYDVRFIYLRRTEWYLTIQNKRDVIEKPNFYVLRPVLACNWIERGLGVVPMEFERLVDGIVTDPDLRGEIDHLLERKRSGAELDEGPRNRILSGFLEDELNRLRAEAQPPAKSKDTAFLDRLFVSLLVEVNGKALQYSS
jgi:predicted nucleotidyltransferase